MITRFETNSKADDTPLFGVTYTPDNPVAVLNIVHGFGEHCGRYAHMMDHLGENGIASAAIDVRGHGQSGGKHGVCYKYELLHGDVEALLEHSQTTFSGLPQFLFGHSMGGGLVLHYALTHGATNMHAVIASAPLLTLTKPLPGPLESLMRILRWISPDLTVRNKISGEQVSSIPEERTAYENDSLNHDRLGVGLGVGMFDAGRWALDNAKNMPVPSLLLHSRNDQLTGFDGSEEFASKAPDCKFRIFETVEHEMHNDHSRPDVYAELLEFIGTHS